MRLKASIAKSLIGALVTVLVMSMVMAREMEPQDEDRFFKRIKPHLSTNITSGCTNKTRERRLGINLMHDEIIATFASKLGADLSQGKEEIPALQKYERYFEVISNFPSFLKENDLKESSSKEVLEILLRHMDRDTALVSDLGLLDMKKADELIILLLSKWKEDKVTLEDALERLMLGKSVDEFLDSDLINAWGYFGTLLTGVSGAPALRQMLSVLSEKFGFVGLAEALVVRHTAGENSMSGRLYRQQLLVWNEKEVSQESIFDHMGEDLGLSVWMDFVLLRAPNDYDPSSYRIEVLKWLHKKNINLNQLDEKMQYIRDLMNNQLIIQKLMIKLVMKKEVMKKRLTNKKLWTEELEYKESTNKQLMAMNSELMNDESISKSLLNKEDVLIKELMKRKSMIEDLVKKESMIEDLMKKESMIEDLMKKELKNMELSTKNLIIEKSYDKNRDSDIEEIEQEIEQNAAVIKEWMMKYDTNEELMNKELMDKESMKEDLIKMELMIKELIEEKLKNDALMIEEVTEDRKKQDAIVEKLMNEGFTSDELMNKELKSMQELINKEVMIEKLKKNDLMMREWMVKESTKKELMDKKLVNEGLTSTEMRNNELLKEELRNKEEMKNKLTKLILTRNEMLKWRDLLRGDLWMDQRLESRRRKFIHGRS